DVQSCVILYTNKYELTPTVSIFGNGYSLSQAVTENPVSDAIRLAYPNIFWPKIKINLDQKQ
ncbi:24796_t:CDS:1, partial [Gigaspora margarita]